MDSLQELFAGMKLFEDTIMHQQLNQTLDVPDFVFINYAIAEEIRDIDKCDVE